MKFSEMPYVRPDPEQIKKWTAEYTEKLKNAQSYGEAHAVFLAYQEKYKKDDTMIVVAYIRQSIDTRNEFYNAEKEFWDENLPEIEEYEQEWIKALVESPFRKDFEAEYGDLLFVKAEMEKKTFSPEIIEDLQRENELTSEYDDLIASAQIPFENGVYTLSQMEPFQDALDDARRLAAWKAKGRWYKENQAKLDSIYDELVKLRDSMGKKLGYGGYTQLGYYRMGRNCYDSHDVEKFRTAVQKYVVPVAAGVFQAQAERLGKSYPMSFADNQLEFRSGNPKPAGSPDDIVAAGKKFYDELSPETSEFFHTMLDGELMNLLSTEGKRGGGYCTGLYDYEVPFIFANFNGTQGDVEVITHEAGHAFEAYVNRRRVPVSYIYPTMEACECHSMSMEFFAEKWADDFFGEDARKYLYSHLSGALKFIPYGTMVDHFQHEVYAHPEMTPEERHACWRKLEGIYRPWMKLDGDIPVYGEGYGWQRQHHIYSAPFYYIDYCLAQTVSLEFWAMIQDDLKSAWNTYMKYTEQGGSKVFTELLEGAGLASPFDENTLRGVCAKADAFLKNYDMSGIE